MPYRCALAASRPAYRRARRLCLLLARTADRERRNGEGPPDVRTDKGALCCRDTGRDEYVERRKEVSLGQRLRIAACSRSR